MQKENMPMRFQDLITKFYYKQNHLCFQIILNVGNNEMVPYKEYTDYTEYKTAFDKLTKMSCLKNEMPNGATKAAPDKVIYA